ncbi:hypothetical protein C8J57DRAFT_1571050 [Mycena rebaudengoi]|nr:hypothetical protein C8J57DRAFT_1571050 [Mycena rebaudengoi]
MSAYNSKRHSLPVGPRPLQLDAAHYTHSTVTSHAVAGYAQNPLSPTTPSRRPSSITYNPATRAPRPATPRTATGDSFASNAASTSGTAPPTPRGHLARSNSVGGALDSRRNTPPLTLAEKHADLLHFIAQKESKCLELRDQLAAHEKELLTLKRKWERIVARGFSSPHNTSFPASASASATSSFSSLNANGSAGAGVGAIDDPDAPGTPGTVLDGIREVGRFIAAAAYEGTRSLWGVWGVLEGAAREAAKRECGGFSG